MFCCKKCGWNFVEIRKKNNTWYVCCEICDVGIESFKKDKFDYFDGEVWTHNHIISILKAIYLIDDKTGTIYRSGQSEDGGILTVEELIEYHLHFTPISESEYLNIINK